jgi:hypothetical protein
MDYAFTDRDLRVKKDVSDWSLVCAALTAACASANRY